MQFHFRFGPHFKFMTPGLEVRNACQAAQQTGAKLTFLGSEMNRETWQRLYHETRMNAPWYARQRFAYRESFYVNELEGNRQKLGTVGGSAFSEKCMDAYNMNWYI